MKTWCRIQGQYVALKAYPVHELVLINKSKMHWNMLAGQSDDNEEQTDSLSGANLTAMAQSESRSLIHCCPSGAQRTQSNLNKKYFILAIHTATSMKIT